MRFVEPVATQQMRIPNKITVNRGERVRLSYRKLFYVPC